MFKKPIRFLLSCFYCFAQCSTFGQKKTAAKYPSLLVGDNRQWVNQPSYLFGTMHVSSKMVFHLSDSFYLALKSCGCRSTGT